MRWITNKWKNTLYMYLKSCTVMWLLYGWLFWGTFSRIQDINCLHISMLCIILDLQSTIANYVVDVSIPTIILFCVVHEDVDDLYKRQTFQPSGLCQSRISHADNFACTVPHAKSGFDEAHWEEMSTIYINHQSSRITLKRIIVGTLASTTSLATSSSRLTNRALRIDAAETPPNTTKGTIGNSKNYTF